MIIAQEGTAVRRVTASKKILNRNAHKSGVHGDMFVTQKSPAYFDNRIRSLNLFFKAQQKTDSEIFS